MEDRKLKNPPSAKEKNLLKGLIRRLFARSDLRKEALARTAIVHSQPDRPNVTKWGFCEMCGLIEAQYLLEVDHVSPLIELHRELSDYEWSELIDRQWCDPSNLMVLDKDCHRKKSAVETIIRAEFKRKKKAALK